MVVRVLSSDGLGLFPHEGSLALQRLPVELDKLGSSVVRHEAESVDTEAIHRSEGTRNSVTSHSPEQCMQRAGLLTEKVPSRVVGGCGLGDLVLRAGLNGMDQVGEEDCILDEEDRDVVSDNVCWLSDQDIRGMQDMLPTEVSLIRVEPSRETVNITRRVRASSASCNSGEADKNRSFLALSGQERSGSDVGPVSVGRKHTVRSYSSGMNRTFWHLRTVLASLSSQEELSSISLHVRGRSAGSSDGR